MPVIEAMACGTPVIASDIPALREVGGTAALYAPPGDVELLGRRFRAGDAHAHGHALNGSCGLLHAGLAEVDLLLRGRKDSEDDREEYNAKERPQPARRAARN